MAFGFADGFTAKDVIKMCFPVLFNQYWYFTAYFALFFAVPLLNKFLFTVNEFSAKKALLVLVALFSVPGIVSDPFKTNSGYSALWLMVLYCIGALAKRIQLFEKTRTRTLVLLWVLCIFSTWTLKVFVGMGHLVKYISRPFC